MMSNPEKFISLIDTKTSNIITIDASAYIIKLEIDGTIYETRLKGFASEILYELFACHPKPLEYVKIEKCLNEYNLIVTDLTRMHRKLSEIRSSLQEFHPSLKSLIINTRGIGYSLPLHLRHLYSTAESKVKFRNAKISDALKLIYNLIQDAIHLTSQSRIIKHSLGFITDRNSYKEILVEKIKIFNNLSDTLIEETHMHEAEFMAIRLKYLLTKLQTYIALARISEYAISEKEWLNWFSQEVLMLFEELQKLLKNIEYS